MSPNADLPVTCTFCKADLTLTFDSDASHAARYHWHPWECPKCRRQNGLMMAGAIVKVAPRNH